MLTAPSPVRSSTNSTPSSPPLHVLILYQDHDTGTRAMSKYRQLAAQFLGEVTMPCHLWRFDVLETPPLGQAAAEQASRVNLIIFAASATYRLSPGLREWLQRWLGRKAARDCALAALIADTPDQYGDASGLREELRELVRGAGAAFFYARYFQEHTEHPHPSLSPPVPRPRLTPSGWPCPVPQGASSAA